MRNIRTIKSKLSTGIVTFGCIIALSMSANDSCRSYTAETKEKSTPCRNADCRIIDNERADSNIVDINDIVKDCHMEHFHIMQRINRCQIILNDSLSILRAQNYDQESDGTYTQVTLNKNVAECFKLLLYELYSSHESAVTEGLRKMEYKGKAQPYWSVNMSLNGKEINETIPYREYELVEYREKPDSIFHGQYTKIFDLLYLIQCKVSEEIYNYKYILRPKEPAWIKEKFNGNFYESFCPDIPIKD